LRKKYAADNMRENKNFEIETYLNTNFIIKHN